MMFFKEIELFNIRQFDRKHIVFKAGFNLIVMGSGQGKSTLIESLQSVFSISAASPLDFFRDGAIDSAVQLEIEIDQKEFTITKKWTEHILTEHVVASKDGDLTFNLTDSVQVSQWLLYFLKSADRMFQNEMVSFPVKLLSQRYDLICELIFPNFSPANATDSARLYTLFNIHSNDHINLTLLDVQHIASGTLEELRVNRQAATFDKRILERFEDDLKQTDQQIKQMVVAVEQVSNSAAADEAELRQADKIYEFIMAKRHEIEKIDFELRSYKSILKNDIAHEFTEDEIQEIEKKKKLYEQISSREESLQKKLIERGHLEKNLSGILHEITQCQIAQVTSEMGEGKVKLNVYESEVKRIRETLKTYSSLDHELEVTKHEKNQYQSSHDKHLVMIKLKQFVSQNEQKKIKILIEKLEQDREIIAKELEQMQSATHEERYRSLFSKVQQFRQQILEQRKRLELLYERRLETLRSYEESVFAEPDLIALESKFRRQINLKKYLAMISEVSQFIQNDVFETRRDKFLKYILSHSALLLDEIIRLAEHTLQIEDKTDVPSLLKRYSHSQIAEFNLIFRVLCIDYFTHHCEAVLDEHYRWLMDPAQISGIEKLLQHLNFTQSVAFAKA